MNADEKPTDSIRGLLLGRYHLCLPMWSIAELLDALEAGLRAIAAEIDAEQSVYGLDARDEVALHPVIERACREVGYGVHREEPYPADRKRRKASEGERCDFVLTPDARPLVQPERAATLFETENAVAVDDAFWLEMKVVHQHTPDGPNPRYSAQFLSVTRGDLSKLSKDDAILHAGLLIVLFTADESVAEHDLAVWYNRCLDRGLPLEAPYRRSIPLTNRHGNGCLSLALAGVRHL